MLLAIDRGDADDIISICGVEYSEASLSNKKPLCDLYLYQCIRLRFLDYSLWVIRLHLIISSVYKDR